MNAVSETHLNISVVMCAYTEARWDDMVAAINSLKAQTHLPSEIILVIDHNRSLFERALKAVSDLEVRVIENEGQKGLSGARNSGLAIAHGDIIAFMDEDASASTDWLAQLNHIYQDPLVMGAGGAIHAVWLSGRPKWFPEEFDWVVGCTYRGMPDAEAPVRNLIGCNMSFRRHVAELNGGFRDGIGQLGTVPVGCEETEFCIRASQKWPQKIFLYSPQAEVFHNVPAQRATWRYFFARCYGEGISKARIGQFVGTTSSLASEKSYVVKTLPKGVLHGLASAFLHFDIYGFMRAVSIVTGFVMTSFGYFFTRVSLGLKPTLKSIHPEIKLNEDRV